MNLITAGLVGYGPFLKPERSSALLKHPAMASACESPVKLDPSQELLLSLERLLVAIYSNRIMSP